MKVKGILIDVESNPGKMKVLELEEKSLDEFYECLNCRCIDIVVRKIGDRPFNFVCDDEGLFKEYPEPSAYTRDGQSMLVGNLFICNNYREHLTSLSQSDIDYIVKHIGLVAFVRPGSKEIHTHPVVTNLNYV